MKDNPNLIKSMQLPPLSMHRYERYLPTAFDESLSILEKMNKVIGYINAYVDGNDEMIHKWNEVYEWVMNDGLGNALISQLDEWLNDGTLHNVINDELLGDIDNKVQENIEDIKALTESMVEILADMLARKINVKNYTGNTDSERIQKALNVARDLGGGTVFIPSGYYMLREEMVVYSNTTIKCSPNTHLGRHHSGYILLNGERCVDFAGYEGHHDITIDGGIWDSRAGEQSGRGSNITFGHGKNIVFKNMTVQNANSHHIEINSCKNVMVDNCKFIGHTIGLEHVEAIQLDIALVTGFPAFGVHDSTPCENVTIQNCYFGKGKCKGVDTISRAIGTHTTRIGVYHKNVKILNNTIEDTHDWAIQTLSYNDLLVQGNTIRNCNAGIIMYAPRSDNPKHMVDRDGNIVNNSQFCRNYTVCDNIFSGIQGKSTINVYGDPSGHIVDVQIHDNVITSGGVATGIIALRYTQRANVSDNNIASVQNFAITFNRQNSLFNVTGNVITHADNDGIRTEGQNVQFVIANNTISRTGRNGIQVYGEGTTNFTISGNTIRGVNEKDEERSGIYIHSGAKYGAITGNVVSSFSAYIAEYALRITSTVANTVRSGNLLNGDVYDPISKVTGDLVK